MHPIQPARHRSARWLASILAAALLSLLAVTAGYAADNPNNYQCFGHIAAGTPEVGSSDQQVAYTILCTGPITGYQIETQVPLSGFDSAPLVTNLQGQAVVSDSFSCGGEFPGYAFNCVGSTTAGAELITGQFTIEAKLCDEPRVDPLLTVTDAYLNEKKVITQAISGPFDLGRPHGCPASALGGSSRLPPSPDGGTAKANGKHHSKRKKGKKQKLKSGGKHAAKKQAKSHEK